MPLKLRFFAIALQSKVHNAVQYFCIGPHFVPKRDIKKVSFKDCFSLWAFLTKNNCMYAILRLPPTKNRAVSRADYNFVLTEKVNNLGALPRIDWVSIKHLPCLFACFYESVSCVYAVFSTYLSTCVARAACFVFCSIFLTALLFIFFLFYKFDRHLCHGAYWCTYNPANMSKYFFHLHLHLSNSSVCVSKHVYAFPSSSILIHIYYPIHRYVLCAVL